MRILSTNKLANHPSYDKILTAYNQILKEKGKVNNKKFYEEVVLKEIPSYHIQSWYFFLKRFKTVAGILDLKKVNEEESRLPPVVGSLPSEVSLSRTMMTNQQATAAAIQKALNIGNDRLQTLLENPQLMSAKEAVDLIFKAMKAQDSRIHAVGKLREDNREQEKFDRAFEDSNYDG